MSTPLHVPLDAAPQATSLTVRALLQRMERGGLRVPAFQRPLRWKADDVVRLFDSMQRGYPIGALLFWKRSAEADPGHRLGGASLPLPENEDAWWIVDGQQRITALCAALLPLDDDRSRAWLVHFDPETGTFHSGLVSPAREGVDVPVDVLGDLRRLGKWFRTARLTEAQETRVEDVQQRILDYSLSGYLMETDDPAALRGVFARMNSTGARMRADEVFQALLGESSVPGGGLDLSRLQLACDMNGFGQPPRSEMLKAVLAMSGHDPTRRPEELPEHALGSMVDQQAAEDALVQAVFFLQDSPRGSSPGAGIPCYSLLPYPVVFVILARWFLLHPDTAATDLRALSQWLWRGVLTAAHERAKVSKLRHQVRAIRGDDVNEDLRALLAEAGCPPRVDWELQRFHSKSAHSRVEILALLELRPRHRDGFVSWRALVSSGERVARELFRSQDLGGAPEHLIALARTAANRVLSDARHTGLRSEFATWTEEDAEALASHLLDADAPQVLATDQALARVLPQRAARLRTHVGAFLSERAGLGQPLVLSADTYADESGDATHG